jgi:hypothetical protein
MYILPVGLWSHESSQVPPVDGPSTPRSGKPNKLQTIYSGHHQTTQDVLRGTKCSCRNRGVTVNIGYVKK